MSYLDDIDTCVTLDFETEKIQNRPVYPPKPVGVALRWPDGEAEYLAWGHPEGNNCTRKEARKVLKGIWRSKATILCYHSKFDLAVAHEELGLPELEWDRVHDAMFLAFLADPHSRHLNLKSLSEDILDWPAEERDLIGEWLWENRRALFKETGDRVTKNGKGEVKTGPWISKTPVRLAGPYAEADVGMTWELFEHLLPLIEESGMLEAYDRERKVQPIFMENEREGIYVDMDALERDIPEYRRSLAEADEWLREALDAPDLNIDADAQLADALDDAGVILEEDWVLTKTGQKSVSKDNLTFDKFQYEDVAQVLNYRNRLTTMLNTYMVPWLEQAKVYDGKITTNWNQVRGDQGGTRTGRPSTSNHNFLNIPKKIGYDNDDPFKWLEITADNEYGLRPLPNVRFYILPDPGEVFLHRDFDGQEMRVFAHYEDGPLLRAYQSDPDLDPHEWVRQEIGRLVGLWLQRTPVKTLNFQALYGGGIPAAAKKLQCSAKKAKEYKAFHDKALPGRKIVNEVIKEIINGGEPIATWGGRLYFAEQPKMVKGRMRDFLYKLINYLCQGSAADITKEALIRWWYDPKRDARFLVTVYDEINISAAEDIAEEQMELLRFHMESIELDLLMKSSGKLGPRWGELEKCA